MTTQQRDVPLPPVHESWLPREHSLYRPRHGRSQTAALTAATVFFTIPILLLIIGVRPEAIENRQLASFPSVGDGWKFFTGMDRWATDHLPLRDQAISAQDGISRGVFGEPPQLGKRHDVGPVPTTSDQQDEKVDARGIPIVIEGKDGWLYYGNDVRGACFPTRPLDEVVNALHRLRSAVERSGRGFVFVVAPDKTTMVPENLPESYAGAGCARKAREELWRRVIPENGAIDLRPGLRAAADRRKAPVYAQLDTHWTQDGALVLASELAEKVRPGVTRTWRTTPGNVVGVPADLPRMIGRTGQWSIQLYDLRTDGVKIRSKPVENSGFREPTRFVQPPARGMVDEKVGMIGDSFAFQAMPYLVGGFADFTVVRSDTAEADPPKVAEMLLDKDVVILEAVERSLLSGTNSILVKEAIDVISAELAKHPR